MADETKDVVVGIDLGTTNSEVAAFVDGRVQALGPRDKLLPSCVGVSPTGELLVGRPARNQLLLYPERTVKSIKRKMGLGESVTLGDRTFSPQELSALVLRELAEWARAALGRPVTRAVITVPAYFSDAQRQATREAGALAGLEVVRILNEPTAASLAYGHGDAVRRTVMIYDLGGGTFDVSIVTTEADVTEVLASHGDTHLGGDDFDALLVQRLARAFQERHGVDLTRADPLARARLLWAAEEAKKKLSSEPHVKVREEAICTKDGVPLHLEDEVSREEYEALIRPLLERTLESVTRALTDAGKKPSDLDAVLLVGGSTRTPFVARLLEERTGLVPRQEVHPDLCVALGAGVLASRLGGHAVDRVLVDVSPYSFGPSHLGDRDGAPYPYCYRPIIRRNTPLPVTRTESYFTVHPDQSEVDIEVFQGDDPDALKNTLVGRFTIEGLTRSSEANEVLCRMALDLDGILHVTAIEKRTGRSKDVRIEGALAAKPPAELEAARARLQDLFAARSTGLDGLDDGEDDEVVEDEDEVVEDEGQEDVARFARFVDSVEVQQRAPAPAASAAAPGALTDSGRVARSLLERSRRLLERMNDEDREDTIDLNERVEAALAAGDESSLVAVNSELQELLFFVEGAR
jgi:molecular chaperone DnaK (HSP70)